MEIVSIITILLPAMVYVITVITLRIRAAAPLNPPISQPREATLPRGYMDHVGRRALETLSRASISPEVRDDLATVIQEEVEADGRVNLIVDNDDDGQFYADLAESLIARGWVVNYPDDGES
jgi:hypothetical protein